MQQFTREQLELGVSPGFNDFVGPLFVSQDVIDAVANNGQVTNNGVIVVEDEVFANPENVGSSGILIDLFGNVKVIGVPPGIDQNTIREIVTTEIDANDGQPAGGDRNEINRAFDDFKNGNTTPIEIVDEGGIPTGPDRANGTVEVDASRIEAAFAPDAEVALAFNQATVEEQGFSGNLVADGLQQVQENGVLTENGFIIVENDRFGTSFGGGDIEAFALVNIDERVIIKGSAADELIIGGSIEDLENNFPFFDRQERAEIVQALDQFDEGNFADIELIA